MTDDLIKQEEIFRVVTVTVVKNLLTEETEVIHTREYRAEGYTLICGKREKYNIPPATNRLIIDI